MHHLRLLLTEHPYHPNERSQVAHHRDMPLHRHLHTMETIHIPQPIKFRPRRRHRHHLIPHRPHLNHHLTSKVQGLRYGNGANYLVFVAKHSKEQLIVVDAFYRRSIRYTIVAILIITSHAKSKDWDTVTERIVLYDFVSS